MHLINILCEMLSKVITISQQKGGTGKTDESLFRILGRDLINEISDIKSSLKHQKKLHKK